MVGQEASTSTINKNSDEVNSSCFNQLNYYIFSFFFVFLDGIV